MHSRIAPAWILLRRCPRFISVLLLASLSLPAAAYSQTTTDGSVRGVVRDEQGAVVPGVTVTAESESAPGAHMTTTDATGLYRLVNLPPGEYRVSASIEGFTSFSREHVVMRAGLNLGLDIALQVG